MHILVTNDDGVRSPGIKILQEVAREFGEVVVVAPDRERSAVGHGLTLHSPLRMFKYEDGVYAVDGTPTDCVNMGIYKMLPKMPDLVLSGVNIGANVGADITYSGTVGACMEAHLMGVNAVAFSLATFNKKANFSVAKTVVKETLTTILKDVTKFNKLLLNVNIPYCSADLLQPPLLTRQGSRSFAGKIVEKLDPHGRKYYWIGNEEPEYNDYEGTDIHAIKRNHVSITPLKLDLTDTESFKLFNGLAKEQL